jgi:hypothetical protein
MCSFPFWVCSEHFMGSLCIGVTSSVDSASKYIYCGVSPNLSQSGRPLLDNCSVAMFPIQQGTLNTSLPRRQL